MLFRAIIIFGGIIIAEIIYRQMMKKVFYAQKNLAPIFTRLYRRYKLSPVDLQEHANMIMGGDGEHFFTMEMALLRAYTILPSPATEDDRIAVTAVILTMILRSQANSEAINMAIYKQLVINRAKLIAYMCHIAPLEATMMWSSILRNSFKDEPLYWAFREELDNLNG